MSRNHLFLAAVVSLNAFACAENAPAPESGEEEQISQTTQAFTSSANATLALAAPFVVDAPAMAAGDAPNADEATAEVDASLAGMGIVQDPTCISTAWQNLTLSAEFDMCVLSATGSTLDGGASIGVSLSPWGVDVGFEQLTLDDQSIDGHIGVYYGGTEQQPAVNVQANIAVANAATQSSASLSNLSIVADSGGLTASGEALITAGGSVADGAFSAVHWNAGVCLPVSGKLDFEANGTTVGVEFLATTPLDGKVMVSINGGAAAEMEIFQPCPSE